MFCVLTVSCLLFCLTCIQYWGSDYLECILLITNENQRLLSFSVVVLTSPTFGVLFGGMVISWIGGYESKHSLLICEMFSVGSVLCAIPVPLVSTLVMFSILLWGMLFFSGAIVALLYGIIITSLPKEYAGYANTFTVFFGNLIGYLPGPFFYEALKEHLGAKVAMMTSMYLSSSAGVLFISIGTIFRYKNYELIKSYAIKKSSDIIDDNYKRKSEYRIVVDESVASKSENINCISEVSSRFDTSDVNRYQPKSFDKNKDRNRKRSNSYK